MARFIGRSLSVEKADDHSLAFEWQCSIARGYGKCIVPLTGGLRVLKWRLSAPQAKHADLPWDAVFSGELFGTYKP